WKTFIGKNVYYYLYYFKLQDSRKSKTAFNFSAFFFSPLYFLYRKVWKYFAISLVVNIILNIPSMISYYLIPGGYMAAASLVAWESAATICSLLSVVIHILWGIYGVWLYRKDAVRKMTALHMECSSEEEYEAKLSKISGPSVAALLIFVGVVCLLSIASSLFIR
ncbi:MAG: DUF2628 domain-containing protein, partial [Oscillospiraceae bacterium]